MSTRMRGWQASEGQVPLRAPRWLAQRAFRQGDIPAVRLFARAFCARAGIGSARLADFVLAVSESAACATAVGPCTGRVRLWVTGRRAFCEVRGDGMLRRAAHGAALPGVAARKRRCAAWCSGGSPTTSPSRQAMTGYGCCCR